MCVVGTSVTMAFVMHALLSRTSPFSQSHGPSFEMPLRFPIGTRARQMRIACEQVGIQVA